MAISHKARRAAKAAPTTAHQRRNAACEREDKTSDATAATGETSGPARQLSARLRWLISAALLFHLFAVFLAASYVPPGVSELVGRMASGLRWYTDAVLTMPGYRFFAPDPGPADMMRVEIVADDGERRTEEYPDLKRQWPRLLYHRHFMLASRLSRDPGAPITQVYANSYARHIAARDDAREVSIYRLVHLLPTIEQVRSGTSLGDRSLYRVEFNSPVGVWSYAGPQPFEATKLELRLQFDTTATLEGEILGHAVKSSWTWLPGPPDGPLQIGFHSDPDASPAWTADWPAPNELVLHYPLPGVGGSGKRPRIEHLPLRRDPPPLAVYRREQL
jgi:hypothetical protein